MMANDPRKIALFVLNQLETEEKTLDGVLEDFVHDIERLDRRDRAFFNALVFGVLRWRDRLDWIIGNFSKVSIEKIDYNILNVLRIGSFQIIFLNRVPVFAAVNTAVDLTKSMATARGSRFVNALLRNIAANHEKVVFPDPHKNPVCAIAKAKSFPVWLVKRWVANFGEPETTRLCDAVNTIPPVTLRTNTLKTNREILVDALKDSAKRIRTTRLAPDGISLWNLSESIPKLTAFKEGWFQVQDEAAQLVSLLLDPQPGQRVLDACAGLGGKTGHISQLMKSQGTLVAMDKDQQKLKRLETEMFRLGISITTCIQHDLNMPPDPVKAGRYHRILLDAPCTGLGVLRRNPDTKWSTTEKKLKKKSKKQLLFLKNLADLIRPSGILVYAVCSTEPEETQAVVNAFLKIRPDFVIDKYGDRPSGWARSVVNKNGYLVTFPHKHHMDGFFAVRLKRIR
jgi:16S rRNA (cytosine967-C5)-methyltransferase